MSGYNTLLLDTVAWDLCLDASGNIAMASAPYSQAQDACSAIRLFSGELWYNASLGIPYFADILGKPFDAQYQRQQYQAAALRVPYTASAQVFFTGLTGRQLSGQVQITAKTDNTAAIGF